MGNGVFFDLYLKDHTTGALRNMGANARSIFGTIDRDINRTQQHLDHLSSPVKLRVDTGALNGVGRAFDDVKKQMGTWDIFKGSFLSGIAVQGARTAAQSLFTFGKDVLTGGMEAGATKMQFQVLAGDKDGGALYGNLRKYVQDSIFGPELYNNAKQMMAFGVAAKDVLPNLQMLGDVAMGDKQRMDTLTLAFSQTLSAGKLMGNDLLQYVGAGFNPLQEMSKKTGKSMERLRDEMSKGHISALMVQDAFVQATSAGGKFHGMLDKMAHTPFGKWQAMTGSWADAKVSLGMSLESPLNRILDTFKVGIDRLPAMVERVTPYFTKAFDRFEQIWPSIENFGSAAMGVLKPIAGVFLSEEFGALSKSVIDVAADLTKTLKPALESFSEGLKSTLGTVDETIKLIRGQKADPLTAGKPKNTWSWGDPIFESMESARRREIYSSNPLMNHILIQQAPFFETRKQKGQRATWSAMPDLGFMAGMAPGHSYVGSSNAFAYSIDGPAKRELAKAKSDGAAAASDAIIGGGQKSIKIYLQAPMYKVEHQQFNNISEAIKDFEPRVQEALWRILKTIPE